MLVIPGYQILSQIYESDNSLVYKAIFGEGNLPVILKVLKEDYPTPAEITRYKQEYEINKRLKTRGVARAYRLLKQQNNLVMVLEDFGGESLRKWIDASGFELDHFFKIAIKIAENLAQIHAANIVHKDINPSNIVVNRATGEVKIIDFGISTELTTENPTFRNPNVLEGTLAYISPEQTGRMNRSLDYRTDFYSLGATFYELLTGELPFATTDPMELVHCHIAKMPVPPHLVGSRLEPEREIPKALSNIIMKLLAKTAEERYQSAWGIKADLEECLSQWQQTGGITEFTLGQNDSAEQLQIPQKLYGREREIDTLLAAFEAVSGGAKEMMLVSGYSGIGKSALVQEIYKPITRQRGYFISGKFDQYQRNIPYSAVVSAFSELIRQLLTESAAELSQWRQKLRAALGQNGQVIIDVIPEVELIVGPQPAVPELGPAEAQNRFNLGFQNFIRVFCQKEHPLVIFLDDLQWADAATLKLMELMMQDEEIGYLLLIGAYRDNEVSPTHPTIITIEKLRQAGVIVSDITLSPLNGKQISQLIGESLDRDVEAVKPLAKLVLDKTQGNPFFVNQFLKTLAQEKLLVRDAVTRQWQWDLAQIEATNITDNVVELMVGKLKKLPGATQQVLRLAACVGNHFDLRTLAIIHEKTPVETFQDIAPAIQAGPVLPLSELGVTPGSDPITAPLTVQDYKFLHDRVQQAAYALIDEEAKKAVHWQIGRLLLQNISRSSLGVRIFEVTDHLNLGQELIGDDQERLELVRLNLEAGQRAKDATAYAASRTYLRAGIAAWRGDLWRVDYDLALATYRELAEVEYLNGNFAESEALIELILQQVRSDLEKAEIYQLLLIQYTMSARYEEAIQTGQKALALLGIDLPDRNFDEALAMEIAKGKENLGDREIASLIDAPEITIPEQRLAVQLLVNIDPPAYFAKQELYSVIVAKGTNIALQYGNIAESAKSFVTYGIVQGSILGDYRAGYEFGQLAVKVSEKFHDLTQKCSACLVFGGHLNHWVKHIKFAEEIFNDSYHAGLAVGELRHSGYALEHQLRYLFYQGKNLEYLVATVPNFIQFSDKNKNQWATDGMLGFQIALWNLTGRTASQFDFSVGGLKDTEYLDNCLQHNSFAWLCTYNIFKAQILYLYGSLQPAFDCILKAEKYLSFVLGHFQSSEYIFHSSLILAALYPEVAPEQQQAYWEKLESHQQRLKIWADSCPENFAHKYLLVAAEMARISGELAAAIDLYDRAILAAGENEFIHNEALANELAAKFWLEKGKPDFAQLYLRKAHYGYQIWGATRKVEDLEALYPDLREKKFGGKDIQEAPISTTITSTGRNAKALDLSTVMKAAQAISGEIMLDKLLAKLLDLAIENAGAQKGCLILAQNGELLIEAAGEVDGNVQVLQSIPLDSSQLLPAAIVNYVARTQENVVLDDATGDGIFTNDAYVIANQPKSVLCAPILNQGQLTGILYLEHNMATAVFTRDRLQVVSIISAQAAISIENAMLYRNVEQKVRERTAELAAANQEIRALNEMLKAENIRMSAELEVTRRLQQMMLPTEAELAEIPGLEIVGFMEPAAEVGGDYYDVLQKDGRVKIAIGDVTGHGLESGMLTVATQAAVRTLLESDITEPVQFLAILNRMIYKNVARMNSDKNLTLVLLDYADGILRLSGQHEYVILVRQGGELELIDTIDLGFPIGLDGEIAQFVGDKEVRLLPGDTVVLYSDGITEAENLQGQKC
ncbi:MAG TPA: AAA family ATPase [Oscillatoriaceae cyanobacterium M33_DOE_052]|uniref:GAF domain-containing protein n=1 Tax=Planktothricoides sp. SpSt-374 TaxID=2282167 RepID=A0A7C3VQI2_9CYAN|nr:AAA family ATPase [Oscillatoriaceae cyanobacterium M33_DOE_052]